jgi:hypothetical protein
MNFKCLKSAILGLAVASATLAADRNIVIVQGKAATSSVRNLEWTLFDNGRPSSGGTAEYFKVPADRYLIITEAAFSVRGAPAKAIRYGLFRITLKKGVETFDLATVSDRIPANLDGATTSKRYSPGLVVPPGGEVRGELKNLYPAGGPVPVDVSFYGFLAPLGEFK